MYLRPNVCKTQSYINALLFSLKYLALSLQLCTRTPGTVAEHVEG